MIFNKERAKQLEARILKLSVLHKKIHSQQFPKDGTEGEYMVNQNLRTLFYNRKKEEDDLEQSFSFFYDYPGSAQLVGSQKTTAHEEIFERITQDIFNATLAKW